MSFQVKDFKTNPIYFKEKVLFKRCNLGYTYYKVKRTQL